jgi:ABC-2 type transport system permease protein
MFRRILAITQKEFIQTMRDRPTLVIILTIPILQLLLFGYAIHMDIKRIPLVVADQSFDSNSRALVNALTSAGSFEVVDSVSGEDDVVRAIDGGQAQAGIVIPPNFAARISRGDAKVLLLVDGSDSFTTQSAYNNASVITQQYSISLLSEKLVRSGMASASGQSAVLTAHTRILYNPDLKDLWFIIPGMIAMLLQTQTINLTALSVVREREVGTIEQLLVTPIRPLELMIGKTAPNVVIAMINMLLVIGAGILLFQVPFQGNFMLFSILSLLFVFSGLGLGLLISAISQNQRQANQIAQMLTFTGQFLSGFIFPIYAMPFVLRMTSYIFPLSYFIPISRGIYVKAVGMFYLWEQVAALMIFTLIILLFAVVFFRQRLD